MQRNHDIVKIVCSGIACLSVVVIVVGLVLMARWTDTRYAPEYSGSGWRRVQVGDDYNTVISLLGEPLEKVQTYQIETMVYEGLGHEFLIDNGVVVSAESLGIRAVYEIREKTYGLSVAMLRRSFGEPSEHREAKEMEGWYYSDSPSHSNHWVRSLVFDPKSGRVTRKISSFYFD